MQTRLARLATPLFFLFGTLALSSLSACKPEYPACRRDKHCNEELGEKCVDKVCQNCVEDSECAAKGPNGEDWACVDNRCSEPTAPVAGAGDIGAPCQSVDACNAGLVCRDGACASCITDSECSSGQTCNMNSGRCEADSQDCKCKTDDDCAMDEICDSCQCVFSGQATGGTDPCGLKAIYFDFDSPRLSPKSQSDLQGVADCMAQQGKAIHLEAHADPRGTEEYNILLTDKRGQAVKTFLTNLGVSGGNLNVVSKGSMEATGSDESGWAQDRRVEFIWQ